MLILVLNCGSSSLKFQLIETDEERIEADTDFARVKGLIERIGTLSLVSMTFEEGETYRDAVPLKSHSGAIDYLLRALMKFSDRTGIKKLSDIEAVGHRIVHGGEKFARSVRIDEGVIRQIEECIELAPLHNPANLKGIFSIRENLGEAIPQVAVFDTSFHSTMPETSYLYPLPYQYYRRHKIRRYGFHGTSHRYVAYRYREFEQIARDQVNIITLHLGNGCSACAIQHGDSEDTSMGFTPLEGLMMGTRSGSIDPSILEFLAHKEGFSIDEIDTILNKQSGLLGVSGLTNDMRELIEEVNENGDRRANLAIDLFCRQIKKQVGAYLAVMGSCDALVFTGGIGENAAVIREKVMLGMEGLGFQLDDSENAKPASGIRLISSASSLRKIYVIPTNEELFIARDTLRCVFDLPRRW